MNTVKLVTDDGKDVYIVPNRMSDVTPSDTLDNVPKLGILWVTSDGNLNLQMELDEVPTLIPVVKGQLIIGRFKRVWDDTTTATCVAQWYESPLSFKQNSSYITSNV